MRRLALLCTLAVLPNLGGCFFVFIPGSVIDKVAGAPRFCVSPGAKVGDTMTFNGAQYRITKLVGDSPYYCRNSPESQRFGVDAEPIST